MTFIYDDKTPWAKVEMSLRIDSVICQWSIGAYTL